MPIKNRVEKSIQPIAEFFNKLVFDFWYNSAATNDFPESTQLGTLFNVNGNIWMLDFGVRLEGFKKGQTKAFNTYARFEIKLERFHYQLGFQPTFNWREGVYSVLQSETDIALYA